MKSHPYIYETHITVKIQPHIEAKYLKGINQVKRKIANTWNKCRNTCICRESHTMARAVKVRGRDILTVSYTGQIGNQEQVKQGAAKRRAPRRDL